MFQSPPRRFGLHPIRAQVREAERRLWNRWVWGRKRVLQHFLSLATEYVILHDSLHDGEQLGGNKLFPPIYHCGNWKWVRQRSFSPLFAHYPPSYNWFAKGATAYRFPQKKVKDALPIIARSGKRVRLDFVPNLLFFQSDSEAPWGLGKNFFFHVCLQGFFPCHFSQKSNFQPPG